MFSTSPSEKKEDWIPLTEDEIRELTPKKPESSTSEAAMVESTTSPTENSETEETLSASASSKDLKGEINVIQELGDIVPPASKQDPFVQNVLKGLDENVKKIQGAVDEHVKPHFVKAKTVVDEHVGKHVQPHLEKAHESVKPHLETVSKNWQGFSSSTRSLVEEKVKPSLEGITKGTVEGFETIKKGTVEGLENVKRGTAEGFENVKKGTAEGFETSKRALLDLPTNSKRAVDEHVLPAVENVKATTQKTLETISTKTVESYQKHVLPQVEKAHQTHTTYKNCYMGTAPGLFATEETRVLYIMAEACLRSYGKVAFCDNPITGGLIWFAMLIGSPFVALSSLSSVILLTYIAKYLQVVTDKDLRTGSLGANNVLVGAGAFAFLHFENAFVGWLGSLVLATFFLPPITLLVCLHCQRSSLFRGTEESTSTPMLHFPYNIVMMFFLATALFWDRSLVVPAVVEDAELTVSIVPAIFNGLSKVFLVQKSYSGVLIFGGTLLCSRILAGSLLLGSLIATLLGWSIGMPAVALNAGVAGYNAALTAAAMAYFFEPSWTLAGVGFFVIVLSSLIEAVFAIFFWDAM